MHFIQISLEILYLTDRKTKNYILNNAFYTDTRSTHLHIGVQKFVASIGITVCTCAGVSVYMNWDHYIKNYPLLCIETDEKAGKKQLLLGLFFLRHYDVVRNYSMLLFCRYSYVYMVNYTINLSMQIRLYGRVCFFLITKQEKFLLHVQFNSSIK